MANIGHYEKVRALCGGGRVFVVGGLRAAPHSQLSVFDHVAGKKLHAIDVPAHVLGLALCGEQIIAACSDGVLRSYGLDSGKPGREISSPACTRVAAFPDKERVACVGADGWLRIFSMSAGKRLAEHALSSQPLHAVAVDPQGEHVAAAGEDGVVRSIFLGTSERREMPGHAGPVYALAFTPTDGRLVSAGDDGIIRIWYLVGALECDTRGSGDVGHEGAVLALLLVKGPSEQGEGSEPGDRLYTAGEDGKIKVWRMEDRRKPRTLDCGSKALNALCLLPPLSAAAAKKGLGAVLAGGEDRRLHRFALDLTGAPKEGDEGIVYDHGLQALAMSLSGQKPAREAAIKTLSALAEQEALDQLLAHLGKEREADVRALLLKELGDSQRRGARGALRERLSDDHALVRAEALKALRKIDGEKALAPLVAALASRYPDMRREALHELTPLRAQSPLVVGLIAERFTDSSSMVRLTALSQLGQLYPDGSIEPLRQGFLRGPSDLRAEVLIRAALAKKTIEPQMALLVARALDDADAEVRRIAFAVRVLERPRLAAVLLAKDEDFARSVRDISRRVLRLMSGTGDVEEDGGDGKKGKSGRSEPTEAELRGARERLWREDSGPPKEEDLEPLLVAMACRTPDTALSGARALARLGDTRALGALLQLSREASAELRREAATALKELKDQRAEKRLLWMLDDSDANVRAAALAAYGELAPQPLAIAESALRSSHEDIRVRGLDRLMGLTAKAQRSKEAESLLEDAIEDESPKVRGESFRTLWSWHDKDPEPVLDRALLARFPDLRLRAVEELIRIGESAFARERLHRGIADRDAQVAQAAYDGCVKLYGKKEPAAQLAAIASIHAGVRKSGAEGAAHAPADKLRSPLMTLLGDEDIRVRTSALETLDKLLPGEAGPHYAALASAHLDLRVRAAELLAVRHDERLIDAMRSLLEDKELFRRMPIEVLKPLRERAARALASLGSPRTLKYFATELLKDDYPDVREQAARGMATAARQGDEGFLLDALSHQEIWVRSWAADGLSRLGDARALPVLTGTLRHEHLPIRLSAVISFAALGPEGFGGMLQGLEDETREVQEMVFCIVLARDLRAFRKGQQPDLLTSALSSQRPEVRFAAARAIELRVDAEDYLRYVIEVLMPPRPDKAADMKDWPKEETRGRMLLGLAEALAGDSPEGRYAAAMVLRIKNKPLEYFREAQRLGRPRAVNAPIVPDTAPRASEDGDVKPKKGWLRRLFSNDEGEAEGRAQPAPQIGDSERMHLRRLAFGAYVGLLRQVTAGDEEGHRVRRDAVDRIVELGLLGGLGTAAGIPPILRALEDPHHLVRRAAFSGLKRLYPEGSDEPLSLALQGSATDVARAALDEFAARRTDARQRIAQALSSASAEVRRYAFELLERLSEKGSLEPLLAAIGSEHADLRIGVLERLSTQRDERVIPALLRATESDHEDLRLRAAELLAERKDDRSVDVLSAFLRSDSQGSVTRALTALVRLGSTPAVRALAARLEEVQEPERLPLLRALGQTRHPDAIDTLSVCFDSTLAEVRNTGFEAALLIAGSDRKRRKQDLALRFLRLAVRAKDAALRLLAASELDFGDDPAHDVLLLSMFADRDTQVRLKAVEQYAKRVTEKGARVEPLCDVLRAGTRELLLPAAEGVASGGLSEALRPLLLLVRAGEPAERERALLALGTLGDLRALSELEQVALGGTEEAPVEPSMQAAATEALGRICNKIQDADTRKRVLEFVEEASVNAAHDEIKQAAVRGLRHLGGERGRTRLAAILSERWGDADLKVVAAQQLGLLGDVFAEPVLAHALSDDEYEVRHEARKALDKLFPKERIRVELLAVESKEEDISDPAAVYLANEAEPAQLLPRLGTLTSAALRQRLRYGLLRRSSLPVAELLALLAHKEDSARSEGAWLIAARSGIKTGGAQQPFSEAERAQLAAALGKVEPQAEQSFKLRKEDDEAATLLWVRALWAGARMGARDLLPRARTLLGDKNRELPAAVRRMAVMVLMQLGESSDSQLLLSVIRDTDTALRAAAAAALAALGGDRAAALAAKAEPFDPVAFSPTARAPGAQAMLATQLGRQLVLPKVISEKQSQDLRSLLLSSKDKQTRLSAIAALGSIGGSEVVELLKGFSFDKQAGDEALRKAAYRAMKRARRKAERTKKHEANA